MHQRSLSRRVGRALLYAGFKRLASQLVTSDRGDFCIMKERGLQFWWVPCTFRLCYPTVYKLLSFKINPDLVCSDCAETR